MRLKNVRLTLANIARTSNSRTLEVISAGKSMKRDDSGNITTELDYPYIECAANRGDTIKVKFPVDLADKVDDLRKQVEENDDIINISFSKLKLTPYAMKTASDTVLSGISAKAEDFTIESSIADDLDIEV